MTRDFLTILVFFESQASEGSVDDEEDADEEGGDARRVHHGVGPRVALRRRVHDGLQPQM
jgi:hypothetical protein